MAPTHKNPERANRRAKAPYNFVPLPDRPITYPIDGSHPLKVDQGVYHAGRLTGWIDVKLETRSPVYVRGPLKPDEYEQMERQESDSRDRTPHLEKWRNKPDFFHAGDPSAPVIPGSSLRGMTRTLVEILGHGRLDPVTDTPLVYRAVGDTSSHGEAYRRRLMADVAGQPNHYIPRFQAGYIRKEGRDWYIQPAQTVNGVSYARISLQQIPQQLQRWSDSRNASQIFVQVGPNEFQKVRGGFIRVKYARVLRAAPNGGTGLQPAVLARSGAMFSKRSEAVIFPPNEGAELIRIPDGSGTEDPRDLVTAYLDQVSPEQEKLLGRKEGVLHVNQPVFYLMEDGRLIFFGHTQMFRLPYPRSPKAMLAAVHRDRERVDLAAAVFGTVRGNLSGQAGRVFFTDATSLPGQGNVWLRDKSVVVAKVLSSPKPTTFQHYLTQPQPDMEQGKGLETYNGDPSNTTLRGYKLYWHKGDVSSDKYADDLTPDQMREDKQRTRMKPVRSGVEFRFRVYFENLLMAELGLLWWSLALPAEGDHCHKIGMGKPYGLGAVKLTPEIHLVDAQLRYRELFLGSGKWQEGLVPDDLVAKALSQAVGQFEHFVRTKEKYPEGSPLASAPRIRMLLEMLRWPGPDPEETRYMEIERPDVRAKRGKRNEYRERPVLPDPLHF